MSNVAGIVHHDARCRTTAIDAEGRHLNVRKCPPHTIGVHHRNPSERPKRQRKHGIRATDLGADQCIRTAPMQVYRSFQELLQRPGAYEMLNQHRGRTHAGDRKYEGIIGQFLRTDYLYLVALRDLMPDVQLADVRIATPSRPQKDRAPRHVLNIEITLNCVLVRLPPRVARRRELSLVPRRIGCTAWATPSHPRFLSSPRPRRLRWPRVGLHRWLVSRLCPVRAR